MLLSALVFVVIITGDCSDVMKIAQGYGKISSLNQFVLLEKVG